MSESNHTSLPTTNSPASLVTPCPPGNAYVDCVRTRLKNYLEEQPLTKWIEARAAGGVEPFYTSIDLRDAGFKLAPVDANLFPAGFNNICPEDLFHSAPIARRVLIKHLGRVPKNLVILPESHTKNRFYVDNLLALKQIFENLGIVVHIGWWGEIPTESLVLKDGIETVRLSSSTGTEIFAVPLYLKNEQLVLKDLTLEAPAEIAPEFILLNNDFSSGFPLKLSCVSQPIEPSFRLGWHTRKKHEFFENYNRLAGELALNAKLDPWHLQVDTELVTDVNFDESVGMERIAAAAERVLNRIRLEYEKRGIEEKPFVFIKSNSGTYGMG
ncbi:MAG TPA: glutamate--cysteine ligase, partial [Oligoflexia bacterium]|nr:glutamate--cysteine ligase [Oligoflexia bacterium]